MPHSQFQKFSIPQSNRIKIRRLGVFGVQILGIIAVASYLSSEIVSFGKIFHSPWEVPKNSVGLVLGTSQYLANGQQNSFFSTRMNAAAELYRANRIDCLLVSGDNSEKNYNETTAMQAALMKLWVPPERIFLDYAGFRTLDSVYRAVKVFGQKQFTIITQDFQADRAILFASSLSAESVAYAAESPAFLAAPMTYLREIPARMLAWYDLLIAGSWPKFLGESVRIETDPSLRPVPSKICFPR